MKIAVFAYNINALFDIPLGMISVADNGRFHHLPVG